MSAWWKREAFQRNRAFSETSWVRKVGCFLCCLMLSDRVPLSIPGSKHLLLRRVSSQRTAANFNFSLHLHNVSYFLYITYIIYINFIYITFTIYILNRIYSCSTSTISYKTPTMSFAQELLHMSFDTGVLTQELLHRSSYTGVLTQELLHRRVTQELFHKSRYTGVVAQ